MQTFPNLTQPYWSLLMLYDYSCPKNNSFLYPNTHIIEILITQRSRTHQIKKKLFTLNTTVNFVIYFAKISIKGSCVVVYYMYVYLP